MHIPRPLPRSRTAIARTASSKPSSRAPEKGARGRRSTTEVEADTHMPIKAFEPKFMKVGVLTAALQELTPRAVRDPDPDRAIEEWLDFAKDLGASYIQLSAALH